MNCPVPHFDTEVNYQGGRPGPVSVRKITPEEMEEINRKYPSHGPKTPVPVEQVAYVGGTVAVNVLEGIKRNLQPEQIAEEYKIQLRTVRRYITLYRNGNLKIPGVITRKEAPKRG